MSNSKVFGYVRVSSKDQNLDRQFESLKQYVPDERDIYADKQSGKDFNRPAYVTLKQMLREGDILYVHELERLGRNKQEVKENLEYFRSKGVIVKILNLPTTLVDYSKFDSKLQKMLLEMVNNILIEVLATMAETERDGIRKRQREGIDAARKRGRKFGRPRVKLLDSWDTDIAEWRADKQTAKFVMRKHGISSATFYKLVKK